MISRSKVDPCTAIVHALKLSCHRPAHPRVGSLPAGTFAPEPARLELRYIWAILRVALQVEFIARLRCTAARTCAAGRASSRGYPGSPRRRRGTQDSRASLFGPARTNASGATVCPGTCVPAATRVHGACARLPATRTWGTKQSHRHWCRCGGRRIAGQSGRQRKRQDPGNHRRGCGRRISWQ